MGNFDKLDKLTIFFHVFFIVVYFISKISSLLNILNLTISYTIKFYIFSFFFLQIVNKDF